MEGEPEPASAQLSDNRNEEEPLVRSIYQPDAVMKVEYVPPSITVQATNLTETIDNLRILISEKLMHQTISFECLNSYYFLSQLKKFSFDLPEVLQNAVESSLRKVITLHPTYIDQVEMFKLCLNIVEVLIDKWNVIIETELDLSYRADPALRAITAIDVNELKNHYISVEILCLTCINSPMRFMHQYFGSSIEELQKATFDLFDHVLQIVLLPGSSPKSFNTSVFDVFACCGLRRHRRKLRVVLEAYLKRYISFEEKVLSNLYKLTAYYYQAKTEFSS